MRLNLDVSLFSVVCELGNCLYVPETDLDDMQLDQIIDDIGKGQLENVRAVLEFNPAEGWCNDITADVLAAVPGEDDDLHDDVDLADYASERIDGRRAGVKVRVAA